MRHPSDFYPTPPVLLDQIPDLIDSFSPFPMPRLVVDLGAGDGRLGEACAEYFGCAVRGFDATPRAKWVETWSLGSPLPVGGCDFVISNPPYRRAMDFLSVALSSAPRSLFLLPLGFLASASRKAFWATAPLAFVRVLSRRPSFTGDGKTDPRDFAWYGFDEEWKKNPVSVGWL